MTRGNMACMARMALTMAVTGALGPFHSFSKPGNRFGFGSIDLAVFQRLRPFREPEADRERESDSEGGLGGC